MKHIRLFEQLEENLDPKVRKALKTIATTYKNECLGSAEHISEYFGEGDELVDYSEKVNDPKIKSIFKKIANMCMEECEGSAEHIFDYMNDDDCSYIAEFLGLTPLNCEEDWTEEEDDMWQDDYKNDNSWMFKESASNDKKTEELIKSLWEKEFGKKRPNKTEKMEFYHKLRKKGIDGILIFDVLGDKF